ncbi:MAG: four helix bundle protein [Candidatus Woykebacteria bacterium]
MKENKGYRNLKAWQRASELAHKIYDVTDKFPRSELFALTSQMRRASVSVPANIAEGYSRKSIKEKRHFYTISLSSLTELEFYIDFTFERKYYNQSTYASLTDLQTETAKILTGLINSFRR